MLLLAAACLALVPQRFVGNEALQPRTYASPSGEWTLFVDPSARDGAGKSTVRIAKQGKTQWTGEKPFTFQDAVIDDTGISGGYGYSHGYEGGDEDLGNLVVALLGAGGETLLVDETPRESRNESHMPPQPCAQQVLLHPGLRSVIVRLEQPGADDFSECWFVYTLSPAKKLDPVRGERELQAANQQVWSFRLAAIPGTPLTLAHWYTPGDWNVPESGTGSEYALYDESWKLVWSLPLPNDLELQDEKLRDRVFEEMRGGGGILQTLERRFEVRHVATGERVTFEVERDVSAAKGWSVREIARAPFRLKDAPAKPGLTKLDLPAAGKLVLAVDPRDGSGPVRDIESFDFDAEGRVVVIRGEKAAVAGERGAATILTLERSGGLVQQVPVQAIAGSSPYRAQWYPLAGNDWLRAMESTEDGEASRAWRIDGRTGVAQELAAFRAPRIEGIAAAPDGGFVLLCTHDLPHTNQCEVRRCARDGSTVWSLKEHGYGERGEPADIYSSEDVAVDAKGSVLVLGGKRNLVQCFDARGAFVRGIELQQEWHNRFSYLTDALLGPDGSFAPDSAEGEERWKKLERDGVPDVSRGANRKHGNTGVGTSWSAAFDLQGVLWTHDGHQLFEHVGTGSAEARFGDEPDPSRLTRPSQADFDGSGRIVLVDSRTGSLHVFAADGRRTAVCIPEPGEISWISGILAGPGGKLYVQSSRDDKYIAFEKDGTHVGAVELGGTRLAFVPRTKERWATVEDEDKRVLLRRFDPEGRQTFETDRRPDGGFFEEIHAVACGPDGTVAVLDGPDEAGPNPAKVSLFDPKGQALATIELPPNPFGWGSHLAVGRRWMVINGFRTAALLVSLPEGKVSQFQAGDPKSEDESWDYSLSPDEKQLWAMETATEILTFKLP